MLANCIETNAQWFSINGNGVCNMLYEVECVDKVSKQVMVSRRVTSFALAREIARHLSTAVGSRVVVRQCKPDAKYDVWLWHIEHREWIRLGGRPMKKLDSAEFFVRFERDDAVPVFWPVGVALPVNQK